MYLDKNNEILKININIKNSPMLPYWIVISLAVLVGTFIRLKGLGTWPLALDEYYIIKSCENITKHGLPQFPNGGYYTRGILMQYMIAPLLALGVKAELAGRIFPLLSNLLAIPALYLIAKRVGNQLIATTAVVIFSFSIWEIEFARFARMYAPFQAIFLWYLLFALKDFKDKNFTNYKWLLLLSTISILVYEGSLFLAVFNFVPFILFRKLKLKYLLWAILIFVASAFANTFDFRTLCSNPIFPPEYLTDISNKSFSSPIKIPKILLPYSLHTDYFLIVTPIIIAVTIMLVHLINKNIILKNFHSIFSVIFLAVCAILNQFGFFILSFLIFVFWHFLDSQSINRKNLILLALVFILNLVYWYSYGILSKEWYVLFDDFSSYSVWGITKRLIVGFFNYPDNYLSLRNYFRTLPLLTIFSGIAMSSLFFLLLIKKEKFDQIKFLIGTLIFMSLLATAPTLLYQETRYTFFLVPILLLLVLVSVDKLSNVVFKKKNISNIGFALIVMAAFIISNDFNFYHLLNINKQDVNYRMIYNNNFRVHLYRRWDVVTPVDFVSKNLRINDLVMINENSMEYYLPRVDYFNFDYKHEAFVALTIEEGKKERWSNAKLIYKNEDLINFIENRQKTIWYLVFPENWFSEINFYERYKKYLVYQGVDGLIKVFKFPYEIY
jgi:hypothetical protein